MIIFNTAAVLLGLAAVFAYFNARVLRLPSSIGLMLQALGLSIVVMLGHLVPHTELGVFDAARGLVRSIDFDDTLLNGLLGYLLFAGALHVNLSDLRRQGWPVAILATVGVLASTFLVGAGMWLLLPWLGLDLPFIYCLLFGSLIAPTDPIAVLATLKRLGAPREIATKVAGESLFNDGVGVVIFLALMGVAGLSGHGETTPHDSPEPTTSITAAQGEHPVATPPVESAVERVEHGVGSGVNAASGEGGEGGASHETGGSVDAWSVAKLFLWEAGGGVLLGAALGLLAYFMLRGIDDYPAEALITLALVTGGYALALWLHVSGPIGMVVAGLFIGNHGRTLAMSPHTREHLDTFWELIDEILNAILFVLIGLEVLVLVLDGRYLLAGALAVPLTVLARFISVGGTVAVLRPLRSFTPHAAKVVTWAGMRGGISVALALTLRQGVQDTPGVTNPAAADLVLTMTYIVVVFSIVVQGLTIGPMLRWLGLVEGKATLAPN